MTHAEKRTVLGLVLAGILAAMNTSAVAQHPPGKGQRDRAAEVISLSSTLITVPVIVSDRDGRYVAGLQREDFVLTEDGIRQSISEFSNQEEPISVAILIDASSSAAHQLPRMKEAALSFIDQLRPQDRAMVVSLSDHVYVESEFTSDRAKLARVVGTLQTGERTQLYEAIYLTVTQPLKAEKRRKAILLFSDGLDTASPGSRSELFRAVEEAGVFVYAIHFDPRRAYRLALGSSGDACSVFGPRPIRLPNYAYNELVLPSKQGKEFLRQVADLTGGRFYRSKHLDNRPKRVSLMANVAEELRHHYLLGYHPTNDRQDGTFRRLRVRLRSRRGLAVRARNGYRAPRQGEHDVARRVGEIGGGR